MAHFMEPNYDALRKNGKPIDAVAESKKLKSHILRYYAESGSSVEALQSLLVQKLPKPTTRTLTLNEAFFH